MAGEHRRAGRRAKDTRGTDNRADEAVHERRFPGAGRAADDHQHGCVHLTQPRKEVVVALRHQVVARSAGVDRPWNLELQAHGGKLVTEAADRFGQFGSHGAAVPEGPRRDHRGRLPYEAEPAPLRPEAGSSRSSRRSGSTSRSLPRRGRAARAPLSQLPVEDSGLLRLVDDDLVGLAPPRVATGRPTGRSPEASGWGCGGRTRGDSLRQCRRPRYAQTPAPTGHRGCVRSRCTEVKFVTESKATAPSRASGTGRAAAASRGRPCCRQPRRYVACPPEPRQGRPDDSGVRDRSAICPRHPQEWRGSRRPMPPGQTTAKFPSRGQVAPLARVGGGPHVPTVRRDHERERRRRPAGPGVAGGQEHDGWTGAPVVAR